MVTRIKTKLGTQVGLGSGHIVLHGDPAPPKRGTGPPTFGLCLFWPNGLHWIQMPLGMVLGLGPGDYVLDWRPSSPPKKGYSPPIFGQCLLWTNGWMDQDATWYRDRPQPRRHCVRWGPSSSPQKGHSPLPIFGHVYCDQTAGCIRIPLGTEVGLGTGDIVLDGDPVPL